VTKLKRTVCWTCQERILDARDRVFTLPYDPNKPERDLKSPFGKTVIDGFPHHRECAAQR
jgi:hypothetical protein